MSYLKWNNALINHYFNEKKKDKEIILFADKELINTIGFENNLGNYENFKNTILLNFDKKMNLFDSLFYSKRDIQINRVLKKKIIDFPNLLDTVDEKNKMLFFNYLIFYISIYVGNDKTSFYDFLNSNLQNYLPEEKQKVTKLEKLEVLFDGLESWSSKQKKGIFRSRRIGKLSYLGLLQYQVILKPIETKQLEELIYKHQIEIDDNAIYPELVNKLLPFVENGGLKDKLINAIKEPVSAEWFLNKVLNFDFCTFSKTEEGQNIEVFRKATLAYKIDPSDKLCLVTDMLPNKEEQTIGFNIEASGKNSSGYYSEPILLNTKISFKDELLLLTKGNTTEYRTLKINEINFFCKIENYYIQTLHPPSNYTLLVVVKNTSKNIKDWEKWSSNPKNIASSKKNTSKRLTDIFGEGFVFYIAKNIFKSFYGNKSNEFVYSSTYKDSLTIKKIGGIKIARNIYLDTGLPFFQIVENNFQEEDYKVKVLRNGFEDEDVIKYWKGEKLYFYFNKQITIEESTGVIIKISHVKLKIEKSFDFLVKGTALKNPEFKNLFEYNSWGETRLNSKSYLKGHRIKISDKINIASIKHVLTGLRKESSFDANYFIYILTAVFYNSKKDYVNRIKINKAIDAGLGFLDAKNYDVVENKYSRYSLIKNLIALGFINKKIDENLSEIFQLLPPGIKKIEKVFVHGGAQVFQLIGARTKFMTQKIEQFCEENNVKIRYKSIDNSSAKSLENMLLPELIYLEIKGKVEEYKDFIKKNFDIDLYVEENIHLGDTLLKMSASVDGYEQKFLKEEINLSNHPLEESKVNEFPRLRITEVESRFRGQNSKQFFIENKQNKYYQIENKSWAKLYIQKQQNTMIALMSRTWNGQKFEYSPQVLIPSKIKLPNLIYSAFCQINHGVPRTRKVFIKNVKDSFNASEYSFMYFDQYKISDKLDRRERLLEVLTGSVDLNNNTHIEYTTREKNDFEMSFMQADILSDRSSLVMVYESDSEEPIAIITNFKEVFINAKKTPNQIGNKNIIINNISYEMLKVKKGSNSLNETISKILEDNFDFDYEISDNTVLNINSEYRDEIIIKKLV